MTYLLTYDLDKPGQNYTNLINALTSAGAVRILLSTWLVPTTESSVQIRDRYLRYLDANDRLFVTQVHMWAYSNVMNDLAAKRILPV
jgi:hypothetical protein